MVILQYNKNYLTNASLISILPSHKSTYHLFSHILSLLDLIFGAGLDLAQMVMSARCSIINPTFIKDYCQEASLVTMKNGMSMKVARRRKDAFFN